jgi:hypothetical protein
MKSLELLVDIRSLDRVLEVIEAALVNNFTILSLLVFWLLVFLLTKGLESFGAK